MDAFKDQGEWLSDFSKYRIVECPKCTKPVNYINQKVTCTNCGFNKQFDPDKSYDISPNTNVYLNIYLSIPCCGHELWAFNLEHLDFIESYVESSLRGRIPNSNRSLASRLPQWMKNKKNRTDILKAINKLKGKLSANNYVKEKSS